MDFIRKWRALEDKEVRTAIKENYGPFLRITNILPSIDEGWIALSIVYTALYLIILSTYNYLLSLTCYFLKDDFILFGVQMNYFLLTLLTEIIFIYILSKREGICRIHKIMKKLFDYGNDEAPEHVKNNYKTIASKQRLYILPLLGLIGVVAGFIAVLGPLIDSMVGVESKIYFNSVYMKTPVPMYFPFSVTTDLLHYLGSFYQIGTVSIIALILGGVFLIFIRCIQFFAYEHRLLNYSVRHLLERSVELYHRRYPDRKLDWSKVNANVKFQNCVTYCLKQNAQHHQRIREFYNCMDSIFQLPILIFFTGVTMVIALASVVFIKKTDRLGLKMTNLLAMICELSYAYMACYFGEEILYLGDQLHNTVYGIQWVNLSQKNKKLLISLQDVTRHPFVIKASIIFTCNMNTFSSICNTAYSYFNMLSVSAASTQNPEQ